MILSIFILFLILSFTLIVLGFVFQEKTISDTFLVIGYTILFILSLILMFNQVYTESGTSETQTFSYSDNRTSQITTQTNLIYDNLKPETSGILSVINNIHIFSFGLMLISMFGFYFIWFDNKIKKDNESDWDVEGDD